MYKDQPLAYDIKGQENKVLKLKNVLYDIN